MKKSVLDYILRIRLPITLFVVAASFTLTYFASRAERDSVGYTPAQPILFSHKLHAGDMKIDCQYCHSGADKARHAVIPAVETCMNCHRVARKDRPEIVKLTKYYEEGTPLPWQRIHRVPEFAYFDHSLHINRGIDCASCHGDVAAMETVGQMNSFTMASCLDCHRNAHDNFPNLKNINKGPEYCWACHR